MTIALDSLASESGACSREDQEHSPLKTALASFGQGNPNPKLLRWSPGLGQHTGAGVRVALLDSGLDWQQPQFKKATIIAKDWTGRGSLADGTGHGTQMAALLVGTTGLIPAATLLFGKVLATASTRREQALAQGIRWAVQQRADILALPLGRTRSSRVVQQEVRWAIQAGVQILAAAGNYDPDRVLFPACLPGVMAVTGADGEGRVLPGCAQGAAVDAITLGQIPAFYPYLAPNPSAQIVGSSPATVIAAALAALAYEANPSPGSDSSSVEAGVTSDLAI